jgi:hypothetical protein
LAISDSLRAAGFQSHAGLPASRTSSWIALMTTCICWWPCTTAPSITSSGSWSASDSTISTARSVPATIRFSFDAASCVAVGLITYSPSTWPTRAAPIGPLNGIPDSASAAEAPIIAGMSESISGSTDSTWMTTCTSL